MKTNKKELELCWVTQSAARAIGKCLAREKKYQFTISGFSKRFVVSGFECGEPNSTESLFQLIPLESQAHCDSALGDSKSLSWLRENPRLIDFQRNFRAAFVGEIRAVRPFLRQFRNQFRTKIE